jgi:hypothetical protein
MHWRPHSTIKGGTQYAGKARKMIGKRPEDEAPVDARDSFFSEETP